MKKILPKQERIFFCPECLIEYKSNEYRFKINGYGREERLMCCALPIYIASECPKCELCTNYSVKPIIYKMEGPYEYTDFN